MKQTKIKEKKVKKKLKPVIFVTFSSLDMTGVQGIKFRNLTVGSPIYFNGKKHWILYKKVGKGKGKYSKN